VVVECRYTGVHRTTGKSLDAQACHVWKLAGGKVTSFQQYVDTAQLYGAMGAQAAADAGRG
jgi:ketosteroid isomerase-like protein